MPPPSIGMTPLPGSQPNLTQEQMSELVSSELRFKPTSLEVSRPKEIDYNAMTDEEKNKIYKGFLRDLGVSATWRWDDVTRSSSTSQDRRKNVFTRTQHKK